MRLPYRDRAHAGAYLASRLTSLAGTPGLIVLAVSRGGVPVARAVADALQAPLDVFLVRRVVIPGRRLASSHAGGREGTELGWVSSGGDRVLRGDVLRDIGMPREQAERISREVLVELRATEARCRAGRPPLRVAGAAVLLVDDGLATGATLRMACASLRRMRVARLDVALPVGSPETCAGLGLDASGVVCASTPQRFYGIAEWYETFPMVSEDEIRALLSSSNIRVRVP